MAQRPAGVLPSVLLSQVENTASWALAAHPETSWARALRAAPALDARYTTADARPDWLRVLLAAHYATVGTFVPTDVDAQIRHHVWEACRSRDELSALLPVIDEAASWDARLVSARFCEVGGLQGGGAVGPALSGHDGEWFSVRAGALGRALALGATEAVGALSTAIDDELNREAAAMTAAIRGTDAHHGLCVATTLAHNLGDLSRVVDAWPVKNDASVAYRARYARLGHDDGPREHPVLARAGRINKGVMAVESHRYLPLRKARALRNSRDFLLPFPPWLDAWGELLARRLEQDELTEVVEALLEGHAQYPRQVAWQRALAGIERGRNGGLARLLPGVPARLRKLAGAPAIRNHLGLDARRFEARLHNAWRSAIAGL